MSFWYLDSYRGSTSGLLEAQVLIESDTVWSQDIVGDSNWQHIVLNVNDAVSTNDSVTLELRLVHKANLGGSYYQIFTFWDDIWGWNLTVLNGDFETDDNGVNQSPDNWTANHVSAAGGYVGWYQATSEVVSGEMSWLMKTSELGYGQTNDYVYCRQKVDVVGQ